MSAGFVRHSKNSEGPFYVVNGECMACGAPELAAGQLMSHDEETSHCYFVRQPETPEEIYASVHAVWASCCQAVRYGGKDVSIITKLAALRSYSSCDEQLDPEPVSEIRSFVRFQEAEGAFEGSVRSRLKDILELLAKNLTHDNAFHRCTSFRCGWTKGSFRVHWVKPDWKYSIKFQVEHLFDGCWLVSIRDNDVALAGWVLRLERVLQTSNEFRQVEWLSESQFHDPTSQGTEHPI